jgi:hypothetical protein
MKPHRARLYFHRLADRARTRAELSRREAEIETDPEIKRGLLALAQGQIEQAAAYDQRAKDVK